MKREESDGSDILVGRNPTVDIYLFYCCEFGSTTKGKYHITTHMSSFIGCLVQIYIELFMC